MPQDNLINSTETVAFENRWIPDLYRWIQGPKELAYWSGNTFCPDRFSPESIQRHISQRKIFPFARIDQNRTPLAYAEIVRDYDTGNTHLCRVIVRPGLRGQGLGKLFCSSLINSPQHVGSSKNLKLNVLSNNHPALACYLALGFKITKKIRKARKIENKLYDLFTMTKTFVD
jgi:RimJ/RimL family protein N-acetyltransferase